MPTNMKSIFSRIADMFGGRRHSVEPDTPAVSVEQYYEGLFVKDPAWSAAKPNEDETSRWEKIERMCIDIADRESGKIGDIIDVGCGRGWLSDKLAKYGSVTGIEPVESVIQHAKTLYSKPIFFAQKPDEFLESHPGRVFDLVVCSEVLEHVVEKAQFIAALHRLVKAHGHLIITTPRGELRKFWESKYSVPPQPIEQWISTADLLNLLSSSGFQVMDSTTAFSDGIYQIHLTRKI